MDYSNTIQEEKRVRNCKGKKLDKELKEGKTVKNRQGNITTQNKVSKREGK